MGRITIYLNDNLEKNVRRRAKAEGLSVSKWIAQTIEDHECAKWPSSVLASFGSWTYMPDLKTIRATYGKDSHPEYLG